MKLVLSLLCAVLLTASFVAAQEHVIQIPIEVGVTFQGEREFTLLLPQGFERQFSWTENQTHSAATFTYNNYYLFNESKECPGSQTMLGNLTGQLGGMASVCDQAFKEWNRTLDYRGQVQAATSALSDCNGSLIVEQERRITQERGRAIAENATAACIADRDNCRSTVVATAQNTCPSDLAACRTTQASETTCAPYVNAAKTQAESGKTTVGFFSFLGGIVATLIFQHFKKPKGRGKLEGGTTGPITEFPA